jgi:hypothetical protein
LPSRSLFDCPFDRAVEHGRVVSVHAKHEAAVDHHAEIVQPAYRGRVVAAEVLELALLEKVGGRQRTHSFEQRRGEPRIAEEVIVEEIQMASRQALDLRQRRINGLRIERSSALEERFLVREVADVRAAARDDNRIWHQVQSPLDQIAADRWNLCESACV